LGYAHALKKYFVDDVVPIMHEAIKSKKNILLEGAQGTMLDIDHGTYPYVTSSNPISGYACVGVGFGPKEVDEVLGVVKAYVTRVGSGPFPTEIPGELQDRIREKGGEFGATTGRPRRCGWLDSVVLRHAAQLNGLTHLAVTKLDILDGLEMLKICVGYKWNGNVVHNFPANIHKLETCEPVYEDHPGWKESTENVRSFSDLPENAKNYLKRISEVAECPISLVSVGAERGQIICL
jgi:adenylosuccinate synthase